MSIANAREGDAVFGYPDAGDAVELVICDGRDWDGPAAGGPACIKVVNYCSYLLLLISD